jgi:hypothetical protein
MSAYAPRITTLKIRVDRIRDVIGPGGKVIRGIIEETGVKIDVEDDGTIYIASADGVAMQKAIRSSKSSPHFRRWKTYRGGPALVTSAHSSRSFPVPTGSSTSLRSPTTASRRFAPRCPRATRSWSR